MSYEYIERVDNDNWTHVQSDGNCDCIDFSWLIPMFLDIFFIVCNSLFRHLKCWRRKRMFLLRRQLQRLKGLKNSQEWRINEVWFEILCAGINLYFLCKQFLHVWSMNKIDLIHMSVSLGVSCKSDRNHVPVFSCFKNFELLMYYCKLSLCQFIAMWYSPELINAVFNGCFCSLLLFLIIRRILWPSTLYPEWDEVFLASRGGWGGIEAINLII